MRTVPRPLTFALGVALLACRLSAAATEAQPTEAPPTSPTTATLVPGDHGLQLVHAGRVRSYTLHVPTGLDAGRPLAMVLAFHGGLGTAAYMPALTGFSRTADREGFLVAYPNGSGALEDRLFTWNGGTCCGYSSRENVDDVGFVRAVIDDIAAHFPLDPRRIYATGISNGGILSYRLACELSDRIAAIGPVAGTQNFPGCAPSAPVAVVHFHGTADQTPAVRRRRRASVTRGGPLCLRRRVDRLLAEPRPVPDRGASGGIRNRDAHELRALRRGNGGRALCHRGWGACVAGRHCSLARGRSAADGTQRHRRHVVVLRGAPQAVSWCRQLGGHS